MSHSLESDTKPGSEKFPALFRLNKKYQYDLVFSRPLLKKRVGPILLRAGPNQVNFARIGIIVAKRHFTHAVQRNAIKRRVREEFRIACNSLPSVDIVLQIFTFQSEEKFNHSLTQALSELKAAVAPDGNTIPVGIRSEKSG